MNNKKLHTGSSGWLEDGLMLIVMLTVELQALQGYGICIYLTDAYNDPTLAGSQASCGGGSVNIGKSMRRVFSYQDHW